MSLRRCRETLPRRGPLLIWATCQWMPNRLTMSTSSPVDAESLDDVDQFASGAEAESLLWIHLRPIMSTSVCSFLEELIECVFWATHRPFARIKAKAEVRWMDLRYR